MQSDPEYWFPAKRYGWGWGLPSTWQGWLGLLVLLVLALIGALLFLPRDHLGPYLAYVAVLSALLIGICWLKGEPPRWRWGNDELT